MSTLESIERYLRAQLAESRAAHAEGDHHWLHPFVTISREAGAGGHTLAKAMLEVFARQDDVALFGGWQVFDQRLCEIVAGDPKFARSLDALLAEEYRSKTHELIHQVVQPTIDQDVLMDRVFGVVRALASIGKTIIVGRGGSEVTKDMPAGVSLRLVAPERIRIERTMEAAGYDERKARDQARRLDAHRARLLKTHFRVDIADPLGYDMTWNTGFIDFETIAETVVVVLRRRAALS